MQNMHVAKHWNDPKFLDRYRQAWANSVDPNQTAPVIWSRSTVFAILSAFLDALLYDKTTMFVFYSNYMNFLGCSFFCVF